MLIIYQRYKAQILYLFFGGLTTVVNIIIYGGMRQLFHTTPQVSYWVAWILAVLFAYFTNRSWVFNSQARGIGEFIAELFRFILARVVTGIIGDGILAFGVHILHQNDFIWNIIQNIFVIVSNYILAKWMIFRSWKGDRK